MSRYLLDTSCLVAAVCAWHEHHDATLEEIETRCRVGEEVVLAAHALVEAYAVLTRLPPPHRLEADVALALLEENWGTAPALSLTPAEYWRLLRRACARGQVGGQVYDAVIAARARKGGATALVTWNPGHFVRFGGDGLHVKVPGVRGGSSGQ